MIKCTILIPTTFNNGEPVSPALLDIYRRQLADLCGGYTDAGLVTGAWVNGSSYSAYSERNIELWVICELGKLPQLREFASEIACDLKQKCVYLEWYEVNVEFIGLVG